MKFVILDRDGVINEDSDAFIKQPDEWRPLPGSLEAIARLHRAGWRVYVATNQSGIARGLFDAAALAAIHARMQREVAALGGAIDGIVHCPHGPDDGCECRKPRTGLYRDIAAQLGLPLDGVPVIGDSARDLAAAAAVGARGMLVRTGNGAATLAAHPELAAGEVYDDLAAAVDALLNVGAAPLRRDSFGRRLRSITALLLVGLALAVYTPLVILAAPFPYRLRWAFARSWATLALAILRVICGLGYRVEGAEHLVGQPASIVFCKHQSAWETIAMIAICPAHTWVLKRELMWAPFLGWALAVMGPIAVNRGSGRSAVEQVIEQGARLLRTGRWLMVFPEGTRLPPHTTRRYGVGGAALATKVGAQVIPIAVNAGHFWPRAGWTIRPGTVDVVVGPPIEAAGKTVAALNDEAKAWIEAQQARIEPR